MSVIFDGATHDCEALAIVLTCRFVDEQWQIKQRLIRLILTAKSSTGEEVAHQLIITLSTDLHVGLNLTC